MFIKLSIKPHLVVDGFIISRAAALSQDPTAESASYPELKSRCTAEFVLKSLAIR